MKIGTAVAAFILILFISCNSDTEKRPSTAMDTGRAFIRATLDGDFNTAESFLLKDTQNIQLFDTYKINYSRLKAQQKEAYKNASYNINTYTDVNDSISVINYSNSYMHQPANIKLVKKDHLWSVDFKYILEDSTSIK